MKVRINERGPFTVHTFEQETEEIDVTSAIGTFKPDPAWRFADRVGHFHAYAADGSTPTLRHFPDYGYECLICGQDIQPATIAVPPDGFRKVIPGRTTWTLTLLVTDFVRVLGAYPGNRVTVRRGREWFGIGLFESVQSVPYAYDTVTIRGEGRWPMMQS